MKKSILITLFLCLFALASVASVVNFTADDVSIFPNPERGFTEELGGELALTDSKNQVVKPEADWFFDMEDPENADRKSQSLVMLMYYLKNYKSKDLYDKILQGFDADMQLLRDHGFKCVLRFAYDWTSENDAEPTWVKRHIEQLKPYLAKNADVIYVLETGWVGQWGEWYYSEHYGYETQHMNANRRQVLDAMLDACPSNRFLLVRYAMIKTEYLGEQVAVRADESYTSVTRARIGYHNDAFLNAWGNDGTYASNNDDDDPLVRQYIADETLYVPNGGETNVEDTDETPGLPAKVYDQAESEMAKYHWSFCGSTYSEEVTDLWREHGIFDELNRKMGYRYQLVTATLPDEATAGGQANVRLQIRNTGYAPLYNERHAYIVLKDGSKTYSIALQSDPRRWLPNGAVTTIDEQLAIPADVPAGTYQLYLHLPDAAPSLAADPRYAIRFANTDVWDAATGMNSLLSSVSVSASSTDPTPGDDPTPGEDPTPEPTTGQYSIRTYNADSTQCKWNFAGVVTSEKKISGETIDNGIVFKPGSGTQFKVKSDGLTTTSDPQTLYIPVPAGTSGTIAMEVYGTSDSRWFQLYVNGAAASQSQRLWSKEGEGTDGKKGPRSFAFSASDITTYGGKSYLELRNEGTNGREMKVTTFTVTLPAKVPTGIDQTKTAPQVQKILRNGQLLILKGDKIYTVQGLELL